MTRPLLTILAAALVAACAGREYRPEPPLPAIPDATFYQQIDLSVGIWEEITAHPASLRIGGSPSYIEPLKQALTDARLFKQVHVSPWRPAGGQTLDVLLKLSDAPTINLHESRANWLMGTTVFFLGLPAPFCWYMADVDSDILLESVDSPEPLQISLQQRSHLEGKILAFYGGGDERLRLARRHANVVAGRLSAELIGRRKWFEQIAAAKQKGGDTPAPAAEE